MKITGWCERCKKIRTVRVTHFRPQVNVQRGICAICEVEQDAERDRRFARRQKEGRQQ
jgi:hypothetical protein